MDGDDFSGDFFSIDYNDSLSTCEEKRILGGPLLLSQTTTDVIRYVQIVLFVVGFPIGLVLNTLVIVLVAKFKSLQQTSYYLALQVVVVDLLITLIQFPTTTANVIADRWVFGAAGCPSIGFFLFTFRNMRNFLMFVFVTDRLLTVFTPFWYYRCDNRKMVVLPLSVAAWLFAIVYGIIPIALECHEYGRIAWGCTVSKGCKYPQICDNYKITSVVLSNIIGGFIPLLMYITLYCKARQLKKRVPMIRTISLKNLTAKKEASTTSDGPSIEQNTERKKSCTSDVSKSSMEVTELRRRRDKTATITFLILFISLCGVTFPSTLFFVIGTSAFRAQGIPLPIPIIIMTTVFRTLFNFLVIVDPIAIMRSRDVKVILNEIWIKVKYRLRQNPQPVVLRSDKLVRSKTSEIDNKQKQTITSQIA